MTKAQEEAIDLIRKVVLEHDSFGHPETHEYKEFDITDLGWAIQVITEVGRIGDEDTMASVLCRERRQIFIGPRGGLTLANPAKFVTDKDGHTQKTWKKGTIKGHAALIHPSK